MKKTLFLLLGFLFGLPLFAAQWQVTPDGQTKIGEYTFFVAHWSKGWAFRPQSPETVTFPGEGATPTPRGIRRSGNYQVAAGAFEFTEYRKEEGEKLTLSYELAAAAPVPTEKISLMVYMNDQAMLTRPLTLNGKPLAFPKVLDRAHVFIEHKVSEKDRIVLPTSAGNLEIRFNGRFLLEDERRFGKNRVSIHFLFYPPRSMALTRSAITISMALRPVNQRMLDLRKGMNMGLVDEVENDGKGGWTDQGPDNDMRMLKTGKMTKNGLSFQIADPRKNHGNACIVLRGKERPTFPEKVKVELAGTPKGKMLYLLNCIAWSCKKGDPCALLKIHYADGSVEKKVLKRGFDTDGNWLPNSNMENAPVFWSAMLKDVPVGLYATAIPVKEKPIKALEFVSTGTVWCILGATLAEDAISFQQSKPLTIREGKEWGVLPECGDIVPGSVLDFTNFTERPAGQYGFCKAVDDHLEFEKRPGVPVRLWGANIIFTVIFMENAEVDRMLDRFVANGMNFVRLSVDADLYTATFVKKMSMPERERRVDYFIAACVKRGIYLTIDLQGGRVLSAKAVGGPDRRMALKEYRILSYFDPVVAKDLLEHSRKLLTHVNPYTGRRLADEPALAFLNLINESMLPDSGRETPFLQQKLEAFFEKKYGKPLSGFPAAEQNKMWHKFLREGYFEGREKLVAELKAWGVKCPITDNNCLWFPRVTSYRKGLDFVANNTYWAHPIYLNTKVTWVPPLSISPASAIAAQGGGFNPNALTRHLHTPFGITEWDFVNPNPYNVEGAFLMGGYAAMHNYAALARFSYASWEPSWKNLRTQGYFDFHHDPLQTLSMRAGSVFFLRGDVSTAPRSVAYLFDETEIDGNNLRREFPDAMQRLALLTRIGIAFEPKELTKEVLLCLAEKEEQRALPQRVPVIRERTAERVLPEMTKRGLLPPNAYDLKRGFFRSLTGEIELNADKKSLRIVTPRSEGFVVDGGEKMSGKFMQVLRSDTFAAFLAASLDGKPLPESRRILLLHLTDAKGKNMVFRDHYLTVVESFGEPGLLMKRGEADLALRLPADPVRIYACDVNGKRLAEQKFTRASDGRLLLTVRNFQDGSAVCAYEITR